jgi:hypothetical protein
VGQQALLQRAREPAGRVEHPRVVDRQRGPAGQLLGQHEVVAVERWRVLHALQRQRSEHVPARDQGDDDRRVIAQRAHQRVVLGALGDPPLEAGVHHREEDRLARAQHPEDRMEALGAERMLAPDCLDRARVGRVDRSGNRGADHVIVVEQVDYGQLRQLGYRQIGQAVQRLVEVQRAIEREPGLGEEGHSPLEPGVLLGYRTARAQPANESDELRRLDVGQAGHRELDRELRAVATHRGQLEAPAEDRRLARFDVPRKRIAVGGAERPGDDQVGHLAADDLVAAVAERPLGRRVPIADAAVGPHHDHRVERHVEDASVQEPARCVSRRQGAGEATGARERRAPHGRRREVPSGSGTRMLRRQPSWVRLAGCKLLKGDAIWPLKTPWQCSGREARWGLRWPATSRKLASPSEPGTARARRPSRSSTTAPPCATPRLRRPRAPGSC